MKHLLARNDVLSHNFPVASNNITSRGSNWLWAVMALMTVSMFIFCGLMAARTARTRYAPRFHYICIAITLVSAFAYFVMASNLGAHAVAVTYLRGGIRPGPTREFFYTRWIEYFITFPLEILALLTLARAAKSTKAYVIGVTMFMIICHLTGALVRTRYKWGFFAFGLFAYLLIVWKMATNVRRSAASDVHERTASSTSNLHSSTTHQKQTTSSDSRGTKYHTLTAYLLLLWLLYPICWALSEGGNVLSLDSECIFYGILDIFTKPLFGALLLFMVRDYDHDSNKTMRTSTASTLRGEPAV